MKLQLLSAALLAASALGAEKEVCVENHCTIERYSIFSPAMNRDIRIAVVLPPAYGEHPDRRFPILHTLHGYAAPYDTWANMAPLRQALKDCPMIVTCLDGDKGSWYLDSPLRPESQFKTFFFDEFIPYLDQHYRTDPTRRAVTGFSMGGAGAFQYMLARPELFQSVSSLSGAFYSLTPPNEKMHNHLKDMIGTYDDHPERYQALDCSIGIRQATHLPPVYLHCGTDDFLIEENRRMHQLLTNCAFNATYKETAGAHDWPFWKAASSAVIHFHWSHSLAP